MALFDSDLLSQDWSFGFDDPSAELSNSFSSPSFYDDWDTLAAYFDSTGNDLYADQASGIDTQWLSDLWAFDNLGDTNLSRYIDQDLNYMPELEDSAIQWADLNNMFDMAYDTNSPWQVDGQAVPWEEGKDWDFTGYTEGSDWLNTGILAPMYESGIGGPIGDFLSKAVMAQYNQKPPQSSMKSTLSKVLGTANSALKKTSDAKNSPLGQIALALLKAAQNRKGVKNGNKAIQTAAQTARAESQRGLAPNRGNLNLSGEVRDPMSYVAQAPMIQR